MCTEQLPPGGYPIAFKYMSYQYHYILDQYYVDTDSVWTSLTSRDLVSRNFYNSRRYLSAFIYFVFNVRFLKKYWFITVNTKLT
jgi:hypothetical protein